MASALPPLAQAFSGAIGSAAANAVSYPLDLVATKLQTTTSRRLRGFRGTIRLFKYILQEEGILGIYDGLGADTASTIVSNFLYFYFYTLLHALVARRRASTNTPLLETIKHALTAPTKSVLLGVPTELAVGFAAGVASRAVSTPLSVVTVRLQTANEDDSEDEPTATKKPPSQPPSFMSIVQNIYAEEGLGGFWAGFRPTLPLCLTPALTLLLFQLLSRLRLRLPSRLFLSSIRAHAIANTHSSSAKPSQSALNAFLSGASANALAVTILYPLLLAKVRVQAARRSSNAAADPELGAEKENGVEKEPGKGKGPSMTDVWAAAVRADGWAGLYQALGAQIVKGFVSQGVTMLVKQRVERAVVRVYSSSRAS